MRTSVKWDAAGQWCSEVQEQEWVATESQSETCPYCSDGFMGVHVSNPSCNLKILQGVNSNAVKKRLKKEVCVIQPWPIETKSLAGLWGNPFLSQAFSVCFSVSLFLHVPLSTGQLEFSSDQRGATANTAKASGHKTLRSSWPKVLLALNQEFPSSEELYHSVSRHLRQDRDISLWEWHP